MPKGIYAAASAMLTESRALDVAAQNMANAQSAGYRRAVPLRGRFAQLLAMQRGRFEDLAGNGGAGVYAKGLYRDFSNGERHQTDAPLDLALRGDAFYRVRDMQDRLLLTRSSSFAMDDANRLVTAQGWAVEGQGGAITIPDEASRVTVDEVGRVWAYQPTETGLQPQFVDQLRIGTVDDPSAMEVVNGQYFAPGDVPVRDAVDYQVQQGYVEESNVDPLQEMVHMVTIQRRYDAAQRAMRAQMDTGGNLSEILAR